MGTITTHALDTSLGHPARGLPLRLEAYIGSQDAWMPVKDAVTNDDGRVDAFTDDVQIVAGIYRVTFDTETYFRSTEGIDRWFYPYVTIVFEIDDPTAHFHIPLLISPFGYSTYRGS